MTAPESALRLAGRKARSLAPDRAARVAAEQLIGLRTVAATAITR